MQNGEKTKVLLNNVLNIYRENKMTYYLKEYSNEPTPAFLWSYFGALGIMYQMSRLYPEDIAVLKEYKTMLDHVIYYRNSDSNDIWAKYNSGKGFNGYDSNDRQLLTQASFAEIHALLQITKQNTTISQMEETKCFF